MIGGHLKDQEKLDEGKEENRKKGKENDGWKGEAGIKTGLRQRGHIPLRFHYLLVV